KLTLLGSIVWADGTTERLSGSRTAKLSPEEIRQEEQKGAKGAKGKAKGSKATEGETEQKSEEDKTEGKALYAVNYPLGDFGRAEPPQQPKVVACKNSILWTCRTAG